MTPFGHRIETELENEANRMANEWFFIWHRLNYDEVVDVDDFCGRRIRIGGVTFWGSPELVYWEALRRYVLNKIDTLFGRAENEIRSTSATHASAIASDCARVLNVFCGRILAQAIETDRRLKGNGSPERGYTSPYADRISYAHQIEQRKLSLTSFYTANSVQTTFGSRVEKFVERNKGKLQVLGSIVAMLGLAIAAIKLLT